MIKIDNNVVVVGGVGAKAPTRLYPALSLALPGDAVFDKTNSTGIWHGQETTLCRSLACLPHTGFYLFRW